MSAEQRKVEEALLQDKIKKLQKQISMINYI